MGFFNVAQDNDKKKELKESSPVAKETTPSAPEVRIRFCSQAEIDTVHPERGNE